MDSEAVVLSEAEVDAARSLSAETGKPLATCLQERTGWDAEAVLAVLARQFGYRPLSGPEFDLLEPAFDCVAYGECSRMRALVARDADGAVRIVLTDPLDGFTEEWLLRRCAEFEQEVVEVLLAHPDDLAAYLSQKERQLQAMDGYETPDAANNDAEVVADITLSSIGEDASPVVKLVNSTIYDALKLRASDIHLECDAGCLHVQYRIDGVLVPITQIQGHDMAEQVISRIKVMAELDIAERRIPQDGRFKVRVNGREIDFRVSIMPNIFGEDAVLRLLDRQALTERASELRLDSLGFDPHAIGAIRKLARKAHGMLLVTGPTGSGKTTTLYAAITEIHSGRDKIVTIEDPVEYRLPRVLQIPVNEKKGLTFARGLRSILRHDPDKIMVGEIRDDETAQIAVQAALTGHLVFTTVHANNVFDVLGRFLHMGVDAYSFAAALNGIVAQRLLRINCPHCAVHAAPSPEELATAGLTVDQTSNWSYKAGPGCSHCRGTGFKGRKAVAEVLLLDDILREMIASQALISQLKTRAVETGFRPLLNSAMELVARGDTTLAEVSRVAG